MQNFVLTPPREAREWATFPWWLAGKEYEIE